MKIFGLEENVGRDFLKSFSLVIKLCHQFLLLRFSTALVAS